MNTSNYDTFPYRDMVMIHGEEDQIDMLQERCGDLVGAIGRFRRDTSEPEELCCAIADVEMLLRQMYAIFPGLCNVMDEKEEELEELARAAYFVGDGK